MGSIREKNNIAIAILEKLPLIKSNINDFTFIMVAIIFLPTVY